MPTQTATFKRLTDARRWAAQVDAATMEGRSLSGSAARQHTVADLIDRYLTSILPRKRPKTIVNQKQRLGWWRDSIGHLRLSDVTPAVLADHRDKLAETRAPATVTRYLAVFGHSLSIAVREWQWLDDNPMRRVSKPQEPRGRVRFLSDDERKRLLDVCKNSRSSYLYHIVLLALSTGARKGEILSLRWADVDLARGQVAFQDTKNQQRRSVPLAGPALELMRQHAKVRRIETDLVFPRSDCQAPIDIRKTWHTAVRKAEIPDFRFHDLRHSAASYLAMSGASLVEIAEILGHKTLAMVQRYAHLSEAHTAGVVARMNAMIFEVI
jgi:integrase